MKTYLYYRICIQLILATVIINNAFSQTLVRPVMDSAMPTLRGGGPDKLKMAFHKDGIHFIVYSGYKKTDGEYDTYASRWDWRTGMFDTTVSVDKNLFYSGNQPSRYDIPEEFSADPNFNYTFPDGSRQVIASNLNPKEIDIWALKKGKLNYRISNRRISVPDYQFSVDNVIHPSLPICAYVTNSTQSNGVTWQKKDPHIVIYDAEKDMEIGKLFYPEAVEKYKAAMKKYIADSTALAEKTNQSILEVRKLVAGIRESGWNIEQIRYGFGNSNGNAKSDLRALWEFVPDDKKVYAYITLLGYEKVYTEFRASRQERDFPDLNYYVFSDRSKTYLLTNNIPYLISDAIYQSSSNPLKLGIELSCGYSNECLQDEMADSNRVCRMLISAQKTTAKEMEIKALNRKIKVVDIEEAYQADLAKQGKLQQQKKLDEQAAAKKAKEEEARNYSSAKTLFAEYKAKMQKTEKIRKEIYDTLIPANSLYVLQTDFAPDEERMVLVAVKGLDQYVYMDADIETEKNYVNFDERLGKIQARNYSISVTNYTGPLKALRIGSKADTAIRVSILLSTRKNAEVAAEMQKAQQQTKTPTPSNKSWGVENYANEEIARKVHTQLVYVSEATEKAYNDVRKGGDGMSLSGYKTVITDLKSVINTRRTNSINLLTGLKWSSDNPTKDKFKNFGDAVNAVFNIAVNKINDLTDMYNDASSNGKQVSNYNFQLKMDELRRNIAKALELKDKVY